MCFIVNLEYFYCDHCLNFIGFSIGITSCELNVVTLLAFIQQSSIQNPVVSLWFLMDLSGNSFFLKTRHILFTISLEIIKT